MPASTCRSRASKHEIALYAHYGWTPYWGGAGTGILDAGIAPLGANVLFLPEMGQIVAPDAAFAGEKPGAGEPALQSVRDMTGYKINAVDGDIGEAVDFLVESESWTLRYAIVDTGKWLPGKKVLLSPRWVRDIHWDDRRIHVDLTRDAVKNSPEFHPERSVDRKYEAELHEYYDQPTYWGF
jgi:hypothetical protein